MSSFVCGTIVAVVVCAVPLASQQVGGPEDVGECVRQVGVMVGQVVEQVGVMVGQVVEHHLTRYHLVLITTTRHSHITASILRHLTRVVGPNVVVDVESFFSHDLQPPQDSLPDDTSAATPHPPSWQKASHHKSTEDPLRQHQTPPEHLTRDNLLQGLWGDSRTTCWGLILDLTSSSNTTHLALRYSAYPCPRI
nr:uncharacterized protein LOC123765605 [Procambarus clarkii]